MAGYQTDRHWSDRFIPAIQRLVGPRLLAPSSFEVDTREAADLVVLRARDMTIACRVRRHGYANRFPYDFTIRSARDSGAKTELSKITDGWGDWMFYGHSDETEVAFARWFLIDLSHWRAQLIRNRSEIVMEKRSNGDGTHFAVFDIRSFRPHPPVVIASSHEIPHIPASEMAA